MKKTKIVCTLGPASETEEVISAMADAALEGKQGEQNAPAEEAPAAETVEEKASVQA